MHDRDALLLASAADPDDDLPRLAFADWLTDNGDPQRADFIRLQCQRDALSPLDPAGLLLEIRAAELLHANLTDWNAQAAAVLPLPLTGYRRGFPVLSSTADNLAELEYLPADAPLGGMEVSLPLEEENWNTFGRSLLRAFGLGDRVSPYWSSPTWRRVAWLRVRTIRDESIVRFLAQTSAFSNLRHLELHSSYALLAGLGDEGAMELARIPWLAGLRRLAIRDRTIGQLGVAALANSRWLMNLDHLSLRLSHAGVHAALSVANSGGLQHLTSLDLLSENWSDRTRCPLIEVVTRLGKLKHLRYTGPVANPHLLTFAGSPGLRRFVALELHNAANDDAAEALARSPHLTNLRSLALTASWVMPEGAEAIALSPHLSGLTILDLSGNPLTDAGVRELAKGTSLTNLVSLDLSACGLGDDGVRALARSPHLGKLQYLNLSNNDLTDDGARALAGSSTLRSLRLLQLWPNRHLTSAGSSALSQSPNLPRLVPMYDETRLDVLRGRSSAPE